MKKNKYKEGTIQIFPVGIIMSIIISGIISFIGNKEYIATGQFPIKTAMIVGGLFGILLIWAAIVTYLCNKEDEINNRK